MDVAASARVGGFKPAGRVVRTEPAATVGRGPGDRDATMLEIDGRTGGGQVLRTALSLSAVTGRPFELTDVRANRPSPGLKPQHLAAIETVAALCDADVEGAAADTRALTFEPGALDPRDLDVDIGTAGSVALLFDAVLPLATRVDRPFELTATGGTDVAWAPPVGYLEGVKLPLLRRSGLDVDVSVARTGFYPAGGGEATLAVQPSSLDPVVLDGRGSLDRVAVRSTASEHLAAAEVAERQAERATELLEGLDVAVPAPTVDYADTRSPGSSLFLRAVYANSLAGFTALGERGKPAETVAEEAVERFVAFDEGPGAVDEHLADQVLVPLALAGGRVSLPRATDHVDSNVAVVERFGFDLALERQDDGSVLVTASGELRAGRRG